MNVSGRFSFSDDEIISFFEILKVNLQIDYTGYSIGHLKRRLIHRLQIEACSSLNVFLEKLSTDSDLLKLLIQDFSITVTGFFREPEMFKLLVDRIFPEWQQRESLKIWIAGCSSGEEVYSLTILLKEAGLLDKSRIFASDYNIDSLELASKGLYYEEKIDLGKKNYTIAGGKDFFDSYFSFNSSKYKIDPEFTHKIVFVKHNLVCDKYFCNLDLILCRNVLIYFNSELQKKCWINYITL